MDNNSIKIEILEDFRSLNELENTESINKLCKIYIEKAFQSILNLTNRIYFPVELKYVALDMVSDFYTIAKRKVNDNENYVKSMSEKDRNVSFANTSETYLNTLLSAHISEQLDTRKKEIYRYRLLCKEMEKKEDRKDGEN